MSAAGAAAGVWEVPPELAGERLDRALAERLGLPRSQVQSWIRAGRVTLDRRAPAKTGEALRAGARIAWDAPPAIDDRVAPEAGDLTILYEDAALVALDKPPGLVVHPGAGRPTGTLVHRLLARYPEIAGVGGPGRPGIVHRLDRDTSGLLVVARTAAAYRALVRSFATRQVGKVYLAIVHGAPREAEGTIEAPIGRHATERKRMAVRRDGRPATTRWRRLAARGTVALLELELVTGRTHQIRVHLRHAGHPLVGDPVYGEARWKAASEPLRSVLKTFPRPALHAWRLTLPHPESGERLALVAPVPEDFAALWRAAAGEELPERVRPDGPARPAQGPPRG